MRGGNNSEEEEETDLDASPSARNRDERNRRFSPSELEDELKAER